MSEILDLLVFLIPVYMSNASPVVLGGGRPLDFGMKFSDGKRILGKGKTIQGFAGGVLAGTCAGGIVALYYPLPFFSGPAEQFIAGFILAFGAMAGDSIGSFIKRRIGKDSGSPFIVDTFFFLLVSLVFVFPFANEQLYSILNIGFLLVLTVIMHPLTNMMANRAGLKKVPW